MNKKKNNWSKMGYDK